MLIPMLICGAVFINCDSKYEEKVGEINVTLKNAESYYYDLNVGGDEEGASIKVQAKHYEKSEIIRDSSTYFGVVYHYKPMSDFVGKDYVDIETHSNKTGEGSPVVQTVRINLTVTK